jgi:hypothetical protein
MNQPYVANGPVYPPVDPPANSQPQSRQANLIVEAAKRIGAFSETVFTELVRVMLNGAPGSPGKYPTFQDHGLVCKVCGQKRFCRVG